MISVQILLQLVLVAALRHLREGNAVDVDLPWSWDKIQLFTDFGVSTTNSPNVSILTSNQSDFIANNYKIISIEKCLGPGATTEEYFYDIAKQLRESSSSSSSSDNQTKILFYWNSAICYCDCYECGNQLLSNSSMWFKDDSGNYLFAGGDKKRPIMDQTQSYVRQWWVNSMINILKTAINSNIIVDGIFADAVCPDFLGNNVSETRNNQLIDGIREMMILANKTLKQEINKNMFIVGNGLHSYGYPADQCVPSLLETDGAFIEHFGAFEEIDDKTGDISSSDLIQLMNIVNNLTSSVNNRFIVVKAWIGPETTPVTASGPSWPDGYKYATPSNSSQIQKYASELITFPLSVYLCMFVKEYVYFSYSWYWNLQDGYYPCENNQCDGPTNWYPEFKNKLGKPLGDGVLNGLKCNRTFEYAFVSVDLGNDTSGNITWIS